MAEGGCGAPRFRLTLRQQMIGIVYFALVFTIMGATRDGAGELDLFDGVVRSILLTPWILGFLVMALDRPGPYTNWVVSTLFMLFPPALAASHDWIVAASLLDTGTIPRPMNTLALNVLLLGAFGVYWYFMGPAKCPGCGRVALIPLMRLWGQSRRTSNTRWCAGCGSLYWRVRGGPWRPERRTTWLDRPPLTADESDQGPADSGLAHPDPSRAARPVAVAGATEPVGGLGGPCTAAQTVASASEGD